MDFFKELTSSLQEAVDIKNGVIPAKRMTRHTMVDLKAIRTSATQEKS